MRLLGFNYNKINAERLSGPTSSIKINTNINLSSIEEVPSNFLKEENHQILSIGFKFNVVYEGNLAQINLSGILLVDMEKQKSDEILKQWVEKKLSEEFNLLIFNLILRKCTLKAIELEEELNLPLHMPLPSLGKSEKKD